MKERLLRNRDGQTLDEFLAAYHPKDYPHPSVTVDLVVVSLERGLLNEFIITQGSMTYSNTFCSPWLPSFVKRPTFDRVKPTATKINIVTSCHKIISAFPIFLSPLRLLIYFHIKNVYAVHMIP